MFVVHRILLYQSKRVYLVDLDGCGTVQKNNKKVSLKSMLAISFVRKLLKCQKRSAWMPKLKG